MERIGRRIAFRGIRLRVGDLGTDLRAWLGPSSTAMAAAAVPYVVWMGATAEQAELAASQAQAAAGAFEAAFAMTVPPALVATNRAQLMMLVATNFFGQKSPAIAANEAQYAEMWAQDAAAMYSYAANSAATTAQATPFSAAPQTTNLAGLAAQGGRGRPDRCRVDRHRCAVVVVAAGLPASHVTTKPRVAIVGHLGCPRDVGILWMGRPRGPVGAGSWAGRPGSLIARRDLGLPVASRVGWACSWRTRLSDP